MRTGTITPMFLEMCPINIDGLVKSPISALRAISQNFTYAKYAAFFDIAQALILNFLQGRPMATFYDTINIDGSVSGGVKGLGKRRALLYFILVYTISGMAGFRPGGSGSVY
jgi:hypothetical protein